MSSFEAFSIPSRTPRTITKCVTQRKNSCPKDWLYGVFLERIEIAGEKLRCAIKLANGRGEDVLKAPAGNNGIVACYDKAGENSEIAYKHPGRAVRQLAVGARCIRSRVAADNKLVEHARNAQNEHTHYVYYYECSSAVLSGHIGETPNVAQSNCRTCCGKNDTKLASEICSAVLFHIYS